MDQQAEVATTVTEGVPSNGAGASQETQAKVFPYSKSFQRYMVKDILKSGKQMTGNTVRVGGWVWTGRQGGAGSFAFIELTDGSCHSKLQVLIDQKVLEGKSFTLKEMSITGSSLLFEGELKETPEGVSQDVELHATDIIHFGPCDPSKYPFSKKGGGQRHSYEHLRDHVHLRARTQTIAAVMRIRNALAYATHQFFQSNGFLYIHTPLITQSDAEGAGELFQVTTMLGKIPEVEKAPQQTLEELEAKRKEVSAQGSAVKAAKSAAAADKENADLAKTSKDEITKLKAMKKQLEEMEEKGYVVGGLPRTKNGDVDYRDDFFGKPTFLTVTGQIQGEYMACALSNIYTFGPTFRAEPSYTSRHLCEFWMIEPEIAFCTLEDDMQCAQDYVQFCCQYLLDNNMEDLEFINKQVDKECIERLKHVATSPFTRISYTEAVDLLLKAIADGKEFEYEVKWGNDLKSEHERYLAEVIYKQPVIVYNYPKEIKAFYMKLNDDGKTVAAMDVLVPAVGELVGGSQREDNLELLESRIRELGMEPEQYAAYIDLRRHGNIPHSGFGLGFERLVMFSTGLDNIRESIPFPRWCGNALG